MRLIHAAALARSRSRVRRPAARKRATAKAPAAAAEVNPFTDLGIRLTYRTVRVLSAIAELTSADGAPSSTQVARHAGVSDLGQISKLLARLARAGLVENTAPGLSRGEAYAWRLTARGQQIHAAITKGTQAP